MSQKNLPLIGFDEMNLNPSVYSAVKSVGYEQPTPVQSMTIPFLLEGKDVLGQARTGTGKTAAFALPLLSKIDLSNKRPQVLVLTPTRELAIQVAESFKTYGSKMKGLNVLSIYGGQSYGVQLNQLKRGVHVVVGTPGRLMDHLRRKTVTFADLFCMVLDEADEMLHMGFIDDVEWILEHTPGDAQHALFSATMPAPIKKISKKYLVSPEVIIVKPDNQELKTINQQYWMVRGAKKNQAVIKFLEAADYDGVIVFVKTKSSTLDVCKTLEIKGFKVEALNGDMAQAARERTISRLKNKHIDILVATDVAARGLDVDRISHVINYDLPPKVDQYVHRIGRTGRAGRTGIAISLLTRNERWMLKVIERTTKQTIKEVFLPSNKIINKKRRKNFKKSISDILAKEDLSTFKTLLETYVEEENVAMEDVAAALARLAHGDKPFLLPKKEEKQSPSFSSEKRNEGRKPQRRQSNFKKKPAFKKKSETIRNSDSKKRSDGKKQSDYRNQAGTTNTQKDMSILPVKKGMERYRIEVGQNHGLRPNDIVGAITNEAGLESKFISNININQDFSHVDLPFGMPGEVFQVLQKTWVRSKKMQISKCA